MPVELHLGAEQEPAGPKAACSLDDLSPDLRYAVQFCPRCRNAGFPWFLLCGPHAAEAR